MPCTPPGNPVVSPTIASLGGKWGFTLTAALWVLVQDTLQTCCTTGNGQVLFQCGWCRLKTVRRPYTLTDYSYTTTVPLQGAQISWRTLEVMVFVLRVTSLFLWWSACCLV